MSQPDDSWMGLDPERSILCDGVMLDNGALAPSEDERMRDLLSRYLGFNAISGVEPVYTKGVVNIHGNFTLTDHCPTQAEVDEVIKRIPLLWRRAGIREIQFFQDAPNAQKVEDVRGSVNPPEVGRP